MEAGAFEGRRNSCGARKIRRLAPAHRCNQRVRGVVRTDHESRRLPSRRDRALRRAEEWDCLDRPEPPETGRRRRDPQASPRPRARTPAGRRWPGETRRVPAGPGSGTRCRRVPAAAQSNRRTCARVNPQSPTLRRRPAALGFAATERTRLVGTRSARTSFCVAASFARRAAFSAITVCVSSV